MCLKNMLSLIHVELCFLEDRTWESTIGRVITQLLEMHLEASKEGGGRGFVLFPFAILVEINAILGKGVRSRTLFYIFTCTWKTQNSSLLSLWSPKEGK